MQTWSCRTLQLTKSAYDNAFLMQLITKRLLGKAGRAIVKTAQKVTMQETEACRMPPLFSPLQECKRSCSGCLDSHAQELRRSLVYRFLNCLQNAVPGVGNLKPPSIFSTPYARTRASLRLKDHGTACQPSDNLPPTVRAPVFS